MLAPASSRPPVALDTVRLLALAVPSVLLLGAFGSQVIGGLYPCEMCIWQRWPHGFAIAAALAAMLLHARPGTSRNLTLLAGALIGVSGLIGVFHVGVEQDWWEGFTQCTGAASSIDDILNAPLVRCDEIQWSWLGLSLAGWNALFSLGAAAAILFLGTRKGVA